MASNVALAVCLAAFISVGAFAAGALTPRAAVTATVLGSTIFAAGGVGWSAPLLIFFVTSSFLSRSGSDSTPGSSSHNSRRRNARQVLANGLIPGLWAACHMIFPGRVWPLLFASALATATADTWATEIGRRSSSLPRDVLSGRQVPAGRSGGVTSQGLAASLAGSTVLAASCVLLPDVSPSRTALIALAGFGGALLDSLLGASLQDRRWCPLCREETEDTIHARCFTATSHLRGLKGYDNDWVNLSASACGSVFGLVLMQLS